MLMPEHIESALTRDFPDIVPAKRVCLFCKGVPAIAGRLFSNYADEFASVPVPVVNGDDVPKWITNDVTAILVSYKNDNDHVYNVLKRRGCNIVVITQEGELTDKCRQDNVPLTLAGSELQPCEMLGFTIGCFGAMLQKMGICTSKDRLEKTIVSLRKYEKELKQDYCQEIAGMVSECAKTATAVYAPTNVGAAAMWWKVILSDRLDNVTFFGGLPEFNHNELVGWSENAILTNKPNMIVLYDADATDTVKEMTRAMITVLKRYGVDVRETSITGRDIMEKNLWTMMLGEYIARNMPWKDCSDYGTPLPEQTLTENLIDNIEINDPCDARGQIYNFVDDLERSAKTKIDITVDCDNILLCGMGGSGIGNNIIKDCCFNLYDKFIHVLKFPNVPRWVNERTVVVLSSYSGNTEEILEMYDQAVKRGCSTIIMTSGGKLKKKAEFRNDPIIEMPRGLQPRHAIGYAVGYLISLMDSHGACDFKNELLKALDSLKEYRDLLDDISLDNPAIILANKIQNKIPVIYSDGCAESSALRWKAQISENSKMIVLGDMTSAPNGLPTKLPRHNSFEPIVLMTSSCRKKRENVQNLTFGTCIDAGGNSAVERVLRILMLGDYVSLYLSYFKSIDPSEVKPINDLKEEIRRAMMNKSS